MNIKSAKVFSSIGQFRIWLYFTLSRGKFKARQVSFLKFSYCLCKGSVPDANIVDSSYVNPSLFNID